MVAFVRRLDPLKNIGESPPPPEWTGTGQRWSPFLWANNVALISSLAIS